MKVLVGAFNHQKALVRDWGLLSDCEIFTNIRLKLYSRTRSRQCSDPAPEHGGAACEGAAEQTEGCNTQECSVDGAWGPWSPFYFCSATCGGGNRRRIRQCNNPEPRHGGAACIGETEETESCNMRQCPRDGGWGAWSSASSCSATCGGGYSRRSRQCNNPAPSYGGAACAGDTRKTESCNTQDCPPTCKLQYKGDVEESIQINASKVDQVITVWGSSACTLRILAIGGGGGGEQISTDQI